MINNLIKNGWTIGKRGDMKRYNVVIAPNGRICIEATAGKLRQGDNIKAFAATGGQREAYPGKESGKVLQEVAEGDFIGEYSLKEKELRLRSYMILRIDKTVVHAVLANELFCIS